MLHLIPPRIGFALMEGVVGIQLTVPKPLVPLD